MKKERQFPAYTITKKGELWVSNGHPWIYEQEIVEDGQAENGSLVDVFSLKGTYLGTGLLSRHSKIRIRLVDKNANETFSDSFWKRRVEYAWNYRKTVMSGEDLDACRIIHGESDQLPGVTVDKFHDLLVVQILSYGMEQRKELWLPHLAQLLEKDGYPVRGIMERNDDVLREKEGLSMNKGWYPWKSIPDSPEVVITENGIQYTVDVLNGQKTGFFLDQKYNRRVVGELVKGMTVLDCFTHTGSFALNAAKGGAKHVTAVDVSASAIEMAKRNAQRNHLDDVMDFVVADVFDWLPTIEGHPYDCIILDPPAFTKSRSTAHQAMKGYKQINYRAMKLLPRGGYLISASCSHFATEAMYVEMLKEAARDAGKQLRQIEYRQQAKDHPILLNVEETQYLKFFVFQVI
ncbi:MAG: class I SAM-dependent rRNA methyltransferase [Erysipelotrichaceae bacterium]|nr:class I SAM-dependent rRNA methyltransferase [Erysipelotrichaceae bacterium]